VRKLLHCATDRASSACLAQVRTECADIDRQQATGCCRTGSKEAIEALAKLRAQVGANIARLNMTNETLAVLNENLGAANSRFVDADVAEESTTVARSNILTQSGTAMLAQANLLPQSVLKLLG